jgi:NADH-quinone oxidoreductase subunit G
MVVTTQSSMAVEARKEILEFLLINHPLDCPICDKGGECPLQEHTLHYGPGLSRYFEEKRRFKKPLPMSPVLMLDRERCIICARCTRFGELVAGDHALTLIDRGYKSEVGSTKEGGADSKFIGNTIMICPVGALTSNVYRFRARPWDNEPTNSTCTLCPVGCSFILDSRDGEIMRTRSRENPAVNDIWLCDKGWFGYEFSSSPNRLQTPLIRKLGKLTPSSWEEALSLVAAKMKEAKPRGKLAAWGGNLLTAEENFLLQRLMRGYAGVNHLDYRIGMPIFKPVDEGTTAGMEISIGECEELSFAVLFGIDLTEEFPVIWLRLKQAINKGANILFFGHFAPEIAPHLSKVVLHAPGGELEAIKQADAEIAQLANGGKKGAIFVGRQYLAMQGRAWIVQELFLLREKTANLSINFLEGKGNSVGARIAGMHPAFSPLGSALNPPGMDAIEVLQEAADGGWDFLYVCGANPVNCYPAKLWKQARTKLQFLVVQDLFLTETAKDADVVLPTLSYVEKGGSFINIEGRVQTLLPGKEIPDAIYSDGEIFQMLAKQLVYSLDIESTFAAALRNERISLREKEVEQKKRGGEQRATPTDSMRASFSLSLFDKGVRMKENSHLVKLAKEPRIRISPLEGANRGISAGDKVELVVNEATITAEIALDEEVAEGTAVIPLGFDTLPVQELGVNLLNGLEVEIKRKT